MSTEQRITAPDGSTLVVLPENDYDRLIEAAEDASDAAAHRAVMADLATGTEERVSLDIVERLMAGENPITVYRDWRSLNQSELAAKAGIPASYVSEMENGKKAGSWDARCKIADALDIDVGDLRPWT